MNRSQQLNTDLGKDSIKVTLNQLELEKDAKSLKTKNLSEAEKYSISQDDIRISKEIRLLTQQKISMRKKLTILKNEMDSMSSDSDKSSINSNAITEINVLLPKLSHAIQNGNIALEKLNSLDRVQNKDYFFILNVIR